DSGFFRGTFSASENGVLVYQSAIGGAGLSQIVRVDREGRPIDELVEPGEFYCPRLSHDGRWLMVTTGDPGNLWSHDLTRNVVTRFTFGASMDYASIWSPDDTQIVFGSFRNGMGDLFMKSLSGSGEVRTIVSSEWLKSPSDWSTDGGTILYDLQGKDSGMDIWSYSVETGESAPLLESSFSESSAHFSPDGKYFVYESDEAERIQIYVRSLDGTERKWQISAGGGIWPTWSDDGSEIFYITGDGQMAAVPVRTTPAFEAGNSEMLFRVRLQANVIPEYDVAADGQSFMINRMTIDDTMTPLSLVQNWPLTLDH
ncbi:MAG: hypothetical protein V3U83_08315, partial [Acidobacteriota bacterium]